MRPFRFAVMANHFLPASGEEWRDTCRRAETLGYSSILVSDHFWDQAAAVPAIMAAADATTTLRVGSLLFCNDYRHPAILAKEVATLDRLSGGRLEMGLGAGWKDSDYEQTGIRKDPAGVRVDRLQEAVTILKGLNGDGPFSLDGEYYTITELDSVPKPVQRPHPPLILGGGGKRVLTMAAREGDIVSINRTLRAGAVGTDARRNSSAAATDQKVAWIREAAGERFSELELNMVIPEMLLTDHPRAGIPRLAEKYGVEPDEVPEIPHLWLGTVDSICEDLEARRERWGVSYVVVTIANMEASAPIVDRLTGR